jgi:alkaline phosphatase D
MHGVASGDPDHESVVLWTRISGAEDTAAVDWEIARDEGFERRAGAGRVITSAARDFTVKVVAEGLLPGERYFFRFHSEGVLSPVGRARTLPRGALETLGLAVVSCSNYPFGYFNAYDAIAADEDVDWVLHLGDYLYEYGVDGYGGDTGARLGRNHDPRHEIVSLADYRRRHAQYKADPASQRMHGAHSLLAIWDDHESANNPWMDGAENHQAEREGSWDARRRASLQAYFEWMPIRDPAKGLRREDYWRSWRFGDLAQIVSLETRHTGRARQIEYAEHRDALNSAAEAKGFLRDVVGAPGRAMLSDAMERFLRGELGRAVHDGIPWRMLANQIPMARTHHPRLDNGTLEALRGTMTASAFSRLEEMARMGSLGLPLYLDPWDGYPWARERFYELCRDCGVHDLLVLTGDSHSFWSNQLFTADGAAMGVELGTTGITSPGDFVEFGAEGARLIDEQLAASNDEVLWTDGRHSGYLRLRVNREVVRGDYLSVSTILEETYHVQTLKQIALTRAGGTLRYGEES